MSLRAPDPDFLLFSIKESIGLVTCHFAAQACISLHLADTVFYILKACSNPALTSLLALFLQQHSWKPLSLSFDNCLSNAHFFVIVILFGHLGSVIFDITVVIIWHYVFKSTYLNFKLKLHTLKIMLYALCVNIG